MLQSEEDECISTKLYPSCSDRWLGYSGSPIKPMDLHPLVYIAYLLIGNPACVNWCSSGTRKIYQLKVYSTEMIWNLEVLLKHNDIVCRFVNFPYISFYKQILSCGISQCGVTPGCSKASFCIWDDLQCRKLPGWHLVGTLRNISLITFCRIRQIYRAGILICRAVDHRGWPMRLALLHFK